MFALRVERLTLLVKQAFMTLHKHIINWLCDAVTLEQKLKTKIMYISSGCYYNYVY